MILFHFLSGMVSAGFLIAALFFLRFGRRTGDPLFVRFAFAFALLALAQALLAVSGLTGEDRAWIYLFRLAAFLVILWAIYRKNRSSGSRPPA